MSSWVVMGAEVLSRTDDRNHTRSPRAYLQGGICKPSRQGSVVNSVVGIIAAIVAGTVTASVGMVAILFKLDEEDHEEAARLSDLYKRISVYLENKRGRNRMGDARGRILETSPDTDAAEIEASLRLEVSPDIADLFRQYRATLADEVSERLLVQLSAKIDSLRESARYKNIR